MTTQYKVFENLLEALKPLRAVVADYATHAGPIHESHDRVLGRVGRDGEVPPYLTWGQVCAIEDAAYAAARELGVETFIAPGEEH